MGRYGLKFGVIGRAIQIATMQRDEGDGIYAFLSRADFLAARLPTFTRVLGDAARVGALHPGRLPRVAASLVRDRYDRIAVNYATDHNNFAPRFGFAFTPGKQQSFVIRGGYGLFYAPLAARWATHD